ncbi:Rv3235 family protein [Actinomadura sp. 6N118]|uniref:Rv3235 family protein n=1 Tax=Actinomadura sp. 6N118 TaxID=3375151 RepID=UPI0037AFA3B9
MPRRYIRTPDVRNIRTPDVRDRAIPVTESGYAFDGALALRPDGVREMARAPGPPELRHTAEATLQLVAEVLAGTRPVRQLARRALPEVCLAIAAHRAPVAAGVRIVPPRILTSWLQQPAPDAVEAGAVVVIGGRVRALALRLEHRRERWRCVTVETTDRDGGRTRAHAFP